jgi:hypothetical protein
MNAAEIIDALDLVEQDHKLVYEKVGGLKKAVAGLLRHGETARTASLEQIRHLNEFFRTQFAAHMREEETTLFPVLERYVPDGPATVARLRGQHCEIQHRCDELAGCLDVARDLEGGPPTMVLRDLMAYGWELWELLDSHAGEETRAVHRLFTHAPAAAAAAHAAG